MIGTRLARYEMVSKLGEGGMGVVYKARDIDLDRFVAIKVLASAATADAKYRNRLMQEARAASALNHGAPGISASGMRRANRTVAAPATPGQRRSGLSLGCSGRGFIGFRSVWS